MRARHGYLLLSLAGAVVPLAEFTPWLATNGLNVPLLVQELFANRVSSFFALDVLLSACSLFLFAMVEQSRWKRLPWWTPVMLTFVLAFRLACHSFCTCWREHAKNPNHCANSYRLRYWRLQNNLIVSGHVVLEAGWIHSLL